MQPIGRRFVRFPQGRLRLVAVPDIFRTGDMAIKHRFMLELVAAEAPSERVFGPDDLTADREPGLLNGVLKLTLPRRGMAHIQRSTGLNDTAVAPERIVF